MSTRCNYSYTTNGTYYQMKKSIFIYPKARTTNQNMGSTHRHNEPIQPGHDKNTTILHKTNLCEKLSKNIPLVITGDGSVYTKTSEGAWLISTIEGDILDIGINPDTALSAFQKSYRSKAQASYVSFLFLQEFSLFYGLNIPSIFHYCGNKGLVTKINNQSKKNTKTEKDLLLLISQVIPPNANTQHVKAHQDGKTVNLTFQSISIL